MAENINGKRNFIFYRKSEDDTEKSMAMNSPICHEDSQVKDPQTTIRLF